MWCLAVILAPELFRKLRETPGMHSHQVSSKSESRCPRRKRFLLILLLLFFEGAPIYLPCLSLVIDPPYQIAHALRKPALENLRKP